MAWAYIGAAAFLPIIIIYMLLVFGAPLGEFAFGGKYKTLPLNMRAVTAVSVVVQAFALIALLQKGGVVQTFIPQQVTNVACFVFAAYFTLNTIMNVFSKSKKERLVASPLALIVAVCFWVTALL